MLSMWLVEYKSLMESVCHRNAPLTAYRIYLCVHARCSCMLSVIVVVLVHHMLQWIFNTSRSHQQSALAHSRCRRPPSLKCIILSRHEAQASSAFNLLIYTIYILYVVLCMCVLSGFTFKYMRGSVVAGNNATPRVPSSPMTVQD